MTNYTEKQRVDIVWKQYSDLIEFDDVTIADGRIPIGTVTKIYDEKQSGLCAIVVKDSAVA